MSLIVTKPTFRAVTIAVVAFLLFLFIKKRFFGGGDVGHSRHNEQSDDQSATARKKKKELARRKKERELQEKNHREQKDSSLPRFIMLMGIPGSGKSTWAKMFTSRIESSFEIVSTDEIRKMLTGDVGNQTCNDEVWEVVQDRVEVKLKQGRNVILDGTNTRTDKRRTFVSRLPPCRRTIKLFPIHKMIAKNRIVKDVENGVDRPQVTDAVMEVMSKNFSVSQLTYKEEGWAAGAL